MSKLDSDCRIMDFLINDRRNLAYLANTDQFKKLYSLVSRYFGFNEQRQLRLENEMKNERFKVT